MKIANIQIDNFLGLESLTMGIRAPINIIAGPNEAGKSSIRDAVQWCLTGQARGLKTHGEQSALIHNGAKAAEVMITLADGKVMARRKTPKSPATASGFEDSNHNIWPGILCDPFTFLDWPEGSRRELLFKLIPGLIPTAKGIQARLKPIVDGLFVEGDPIWQEAVALSELAAAKGFKAAETEAVARRREEKRLKESLEQIKEPDSWFDLGEKTYILPDINRDQVLAGLKDIQEQRDALLRAKGRREADKARAAAIQAELQALKSQPAEPPVEGLREEWLEKADGLAKERETIETSIKVLGKGESFPNTCPAILSAQIPCPKAGEKIGEADPAVAQELQTRLSQVQRNLKEALRIFTEIDEKEKSHKALTVKIAKLEKELVGLEKNNDPGDVDFSITALDQRLENGHGLLAAVQNFWKEKDRADHAQIQLAAAEKGVAFFDAMAKALAPDGLPSQMIAEALGPVNELLAVASDCLFLGRSLILTKELDIELSNCPFSTLSKSAKFRAGVAFQYTLAKLAGARLLLIDEADILDPSNRANIIGFLLEISQDFDTIMLFATSNQAAPSSNQDIQVWWLEAGKLTALIEDMAA